jgi:hypothetical protein
MTPQADDVESNTGCFCAEQRLKLWMNLAVKIPEIFAAMAN